jgi:hypothetical protein
MKPKLRIKLLDESHSPISDRLVDQYAELLQGPSEQHTGPFTIEMTIDSKDTFDRAKEYLEKLVGNLPLSNKIPTKLKLSTSDNSVNPYKQLIEDIKGKQFIEEIVEYLESINFRWVNFQYIEELESMKKFPFELNPDHRKTYEKYQWATRMLRQAKDPMNDKFDFTLMIGVRFMGNSNTNKVHILYKGKARGSALVKEWKKGKAINMKARKILTTFPSFMTIEERIDWRKMHRKVELGRELGPRDKAFYERCLPHIKNLKKG